AGEVEQAVRVHVAGGRVRDEQVATGSQRVEALALPPVAVVERDAALTAVEVEVGRPLGRLAVWPFDPDHLGAPARELLPAPGSRLLAVAQFQYSHRRRRGRYAAVMRSRTSPSSTNWSSATGISAIVPADGAAMG